MIDEKQVIEEMKASLKDRWDYISKQCAIKFLKDLYGYQEGWVKLALKAYDECDYDGAMG